MKKAKSKLGRPADEEMDRLVYTLHRDTKSQKGKSFRVIARLVKSDVKTVYRRWERAKTKALAELSTG